MIGAGADGTRASRRVGVAFKTLGCKVNRVESEQAAAELLGLGVAITDEESADVIVVNTCTVTGEADAKARKAIRHALGSPRRPVVVVTGCLASLDAEGLRALDTRVVVESDKSLVANRVAEVLGLDAGSRARTDSDGAPPSPTGARTRALVKVQDGCDAYCTYCIVPYARGVPRSVPLREVLGRVDALVAAGTREVVLTGINLGRYVDGDTGLAELVGRVAASGVARVRLSSIEPLDVDARVLETLAGTPAVCPHLHVPLQSGSDRMLAAMGRGYTARRFAELIERARAAVPGLEVTTDVIAGFPGETDEDAAATRSVCESVGFARLHVFRYSARAGSPAADLPSQVPSPVAQARAAVLRDVSEQLKAAHRARRLGARAGLLIEEHVDGSAVGTTEDYLRARITGPSLPPVGELVQVRLSACDGDVMLAEW